MPSFLTISQPLFLNIIQILFLTMHEGKIFKFT